MEFRYPRIRKVPMDSRRVIKFFPRPGEGSGEMDRLLTIMRREGYELLSLSFSPSSAATLVFERPADSVSSLRAPGSGKDAGA